MAKKRKLDRRVTLFKEQFGIDPHVFVTCANLRNGYDDDYVVWTWTIGHAIPRIVEMAQVHFVACDFVGREILKVFKVPAEIAAKRKVVRYRPGQHNWLETYKTYDKDPHLTKPVEFAATIPTDRRKLVVDLPS